MANVTRKKKYIHTIEMHNETEFTDVFDLYKKDIYDYMIDEMDSFPFDMDLLVIFRVMDKDKNIVNAETNDGATTIKEKKYTVILNIDSLRIIPRDNGLDIAISINHELAHVYDLYRTMHNKYYKINPLKVNHKAFDDFVISEGWRFWTEFYAYYITNKQFKYQHGYPTFLQLIKGYEKLQKQYAEAIAINDYESEEADRALENFIENIKDFAYAFSKYLAGAVNGKPYNYDYCEKTKNRAAYNIIAKLEYGFMRKILPLFTNTYGKGMANKMYELGKYLIKNLFIKFDFYPIKHHRYMRFAFYT